jgi:NAD(P)-dependent dehydrogenase (short-subunit alcohol dehydrogenase family)
MAAEASVMRAFDLSGKTAVITGGAGLLGVRHAEAIAEMGGTPVLLDIDDDRARASADDIVRRFGGQAAGVRTDITDPASVASAMRDVTARFGPVDILINNAANNPKIEPSGPKERHWTRLEAFPISVWDRDVAVGLTGAFLCSQAFGTAMAARRRGVILSIASDLGVIAPDQRIYREKGVAEAHQRVKPVTYSVVKHGLIGLTRYLATYWAESGVRVNSLSPGGVFDGQDEEFVVRLTNLIPMARMAGPDEYKAAVVFLVSDASSYMTGANLVIDGGRTAW